MYSRNWTVLFTKQEEKQWQCARRGGWWRRWWRWCAPSQPAADRWCCCRVLDVPSLHARPACQPPRAMSTSTWRAARLMTTNADSTAHAQEHVLPTLLPPAVTAHVGYNGTRRKSEISSPQLLLVCLFLPSRNRLLIRERNYVRKKKIQTAN